MWRSVLKAAAAPGGPCPQREALYVQAAHAHSVMKHAVWYNMIRARSKLAIGDHTRWPKLCVADICNERGCFLDHSGGLWFAAGRDGAQSSAASAGVGSRATAEPSAAAAAGSAADVDDSDWAADLLWPEEMHDMESSAPVAAAASAAAAAPASICAAAGVSASAAAAAPASICAAAGAAAPASICAAAGVSASDRAASAAAAAPASDLAASAAAAAPASIFAAADASASASVGSRATAEPLYLKPLHFELNFTRLTGDSVETDVHDVRETHYFEGDLMVCETTVVIKRKRPRLVS